MSATHTFFLSLHPLSLPPLPPSLYLVSLYLSLSLFQSPTENSEEVQGLLKQLIHLENEYRLLKEKSAAEIEELQAANARFRADLLGMEENLNIMTVSCIGYPLSFF